MEGMAQGKLRKERRIDAARSLSYKEGSAVTKILKRLKVRIAGDASSETYAEVPIERLENMSCVKR